MSLIRYVTFFFAGTLAVAFPFLAARAAGGQGTLRLPGVQQTCFETRSKQIPEVCGAIEVKWRLTTLMGEPVANYSLSWKLLNVRIANSDGKGAMQLAANALQGDIGMAAQQTELGIQGTALVGPVPAEMRGQTVAVRFDTGVSVRPGGAQSLNVPGSPDWGKLFFNPGPVAGQGMVGWCSIEKTNYVDSGLTKKMVAAGISLTSLQVCPSSTVIVDALERAVQRACESEASSRPSFCGERQAAKKDPIDDAFSKLEQRTKPLGAVVPGSIDASFDQMEKEVNRKRQEAEQEAARRRQEAAELEQKLARHQEAVGYCRTMKETQDNCSATLCGRQPDKNICTRQVETRSTCSPSPGTSCLILNPYECVEEGPNPKFAEWQACTTSASAKSCFPARGRITDIDKCAEERERLVERLDRK